MTGAWIKDGCVCDCDVACGSDEELVGSEVLLKPLEGSVVTGTVPAGRMENIYGFTNARGVY
jgi:uncharacterized protein YuzB (UPF0349 family)